MVRGNNKTFCINRFVQKSLHNIIKRLLFNTLLILNVKQVWIQLISANFHFWEYFFYTLITILEMNHDWCNSICGNIGGCIVTSGLQTLHANPEICHRVHVQCHRFITLLGYVWTLLMVVMMQSEWQRGKNESLQTLHTLYTLYREFFFQWIECCWATNCKIKTGTCMHVRILYNFLHRILCANTCFVSIMGFFSRTNPPIIDDHHGDAKASGILWRHWSHSHTSGAGCGLLS